MTPATIINSNSRGDYRPRFGLEVREDESPIIDEILRQTGIGKIHRRYRTIPGINASPHICWTVGRMPEMLRLIEILEEFPLRAKKRHDFEIWKVAVVLLSRCGWRHSRRDASARIAQARTQHRLRELRDELVAQRVYRSPEQALLRSTDVEYEEVPLFD